MRKIISISFPEDEYDEIRDIKKDRSVFIRHKIKDVRWLYDILTHNFTLTTNFTEEQKKRLKRIEKDLGFDDEEIK